MGRDLRLGDIRGGAPNKLEALYSGVSAKLNMGESGSNLL
jgi:hypothetical protein